MLLPETRRDYLDHFFLFEQVYLPKYRKTIDLNILDGKFSCLEPNLSVQENIDEGYYKKLPYQNLDYHSDSIFDFLEKHSKRVLDKGNQVIFVNGWIYNTNYENNARNIFTGYDISRLNNIVSNKYFSKCNQMIKLISTLNDLHPEKIKFFIDWDEKINNVETCKDISTINLNMINKLKNNMFGNEGDKIY